jgi:hypothetical protein
VVESVEIAQERNSSLSGFNGNRTVPIPTPTPENSRQLARPPTAGAMQLQPPPKAIANIALD